MTVVDIRNFFTVRNVELIEVNPDFIYYSEEKNEEGHNNLFLLEYDRKYRRERIIVNYSLDDPTFRYHVFAFENSLVLILENGGGTVWVIRVDKNTGEETASSQLNCIGKFADCFALNENNVLIYTEETEDFAGLFRQYSEITGCSRIAYLHDIEKERKYFIKDSRLCSFVSSNMKFYTLNKKKYLLFLDPYASEEEKAHCFRNARWLTGEVRDNIWCCELSALLTAVKEGEEDLPLQIMVSAGTDGMARYIGMDEKYVYFRLHHFPSGAEKICCCNKKTYEKTVAAELDLSEQKEGAHYYFDIGGAKVYHIEELEYTYWVEGVLNSRVRTSYAKKLGSFFGCVEERFILATNLLTGEGDQFAYDFTSIYDMRTETEESFEGKCHVEGNTLVIY